MTTHACRDCGRVGSRGFFVHALRSTGADTVWVCSSLRACEERKYRRWMGKA